MKRKSTNKRWVVIAHKYGDSSMHSYPIGIFNRKDAAIKCADSHCEYRGRKYACVVEELILNHFDNDDIYHSNEVYRAKSVAG